MQAPPVRTITLGLADLHPLAFKSIQDAATMLQQARARYVEAGYDVQTVRISTRPVFDDLANWSNAALLEYARELQRMLDDVGLSFCSLGTASAARPDFPLERIDLIADMLAATMAINATVQLATQEHGLRVAAALPAAQVMRRLAQETAEGFGNFRFAVLACVGAGCPFFPSAYHAGPASLALGTQAAGILRHTLQAYGHSEGKSPEFMDVSARVRNALIERVTPVVELGKMFAAEQGVAFGGIDLSPAPLGEDSIIDALELCGYGPIGSPGTVAAAAALTYALKNTGLPTCGYCGLMLPVLEDAVLGKRWEQGLLQVHQLLLYSAVCGTGLDTVPLPGNMAAEAIAGLLLDVATLALRLNKPLSARLFPVPGKLPGERTEFTSPYLTNTLVR